MIEWTAGFTPAELNEAQQRYGLKFPPDLLSLLLEKRIVGGYAWNRECSRIRGMLRWPLDMLLFDVKNGAWCRAWGVRPKRLEDCEEIVQSALTLAPRLIPIHAHRFIPEEPHEEGNPVFSMYGFDTIYYGSNLQNYIHNEFTNNAKFEIWEISRRVPLWSDLAECQDLVF